MKFIPVAQPSLGKEELKLATFCIKSTWISSAGKYINTFENEFAKYFHIPHAISCSNGTIALHLALLALNIGPGDEVILPALTFVATANAIKYVGAKPIFIDVDPNTWNIDPKLIEKAITKKTKAIMPVHLYGYPADMNPIMSLAKKYKLYVVEDAAEAHGAKYYNKYVGTFGDIGCFSFYGNKIITTGEGGMLITHSKQLAEKIKLLKNHGMSPIKKYYHPIIGYNYRMTNIQAAIGIAQLKKMNKFIKIRNEISTKYRNELTKIPNIQFQPINKDIQSVCWLFSCLLKSGGKIKRNSLIKYLKQNSIDSRPFFYPITKFPMYKSNKHFPVSQMLFQQGINLPTFIDLKTTQIKYITHIINKFYSKSTE